MNFPQYLSTTDRTVCVVGEINKSTTLKEAGVFVDGKGYLGEDDHIWIYSGEGKPKRFNEYPYFWLNEEGKKEFSEPGESTLEEFSKSKLNELSVDVIIEKTDETKELYNEKAINDMNKGASLFVPIDKESDDFLKKIIKTAIKEKGIDISRLKYKMDEKYILPNMKAALQNDTKMSVAYFTIWCELLGLSFSVQVTDNGTDEQDPLKEDLIYTSDADKVMKITDF